MVNSPYGGKLKISVELKDREKIDDHARGALSITPFTDFFYDSLKISDGSYSPIEGFMSEEEVESVIKKERLLSDLPWTIPIIFAVDEKVYAKVKEGEEIFLKDPNGEIYGSINVDGKFHLRKKEIAIGVYGTHDPKHPNIEDLFNNYGDFAISGKVRIFREVPLPGNRYELHPEQARDRFKKMGWKNVVAYQARNPPHVAHEYLQKVSLEFPGIDGLLIHLVVGRLKKGDYSADAILNSYEAFIDNYHKKEKTMLGSLSITMRYAGPKAAIFLAIVRRNFGATHYIVGRDQAGVGNFYDPYAAHKKFDEMDIGIIPLKFRDTFYCRKCRGITSDNVCPHSPEYRMIISQTRIREMLKQGEDIPEEIMRPEVTAVLRKGGSID